MYNGTLINDLMTIVERTEQHAQPLPDVAELERWFNAPYQSAKTEQSLLGVA